MRTASCNNPPALPIKNSPASPASGIRWAARFPPGGSLRFPRKRGREKSHFIINFPQKIFKKTDLHLKKRHFSFLLKRTIKLAKYLLSPLKSIN